MRHFHARICDLQGQGSSARTVERPSLVSAQLKTPVFAALYNEISKGVQLGQVAIYCRVSTDDQSCERQERDLRNFAKRAGHHIVAVSKETASGANNDRPERKKVMAVARAREIDAILVTELSRWGRSTQDGTPHRPSTG